MKSIMLAACLSFGSIFPAFGQQVAGQPKLVSATQAEHVSLQIGEYVGYKFSWPVRIHIEKIEPNGMMSGHITSWGIPGTPYAGYVHTSHFHTHVGADGFPETVFGDGNKYSGLRLCGNYLCGRWFHAGSQVGGRNTSEAWTNLTLTRCAASPCLPPGVSNDDRLFP